MESKAALYIRATLIAICSKRQVSLLNWTCPSFHWGQPSEFTIQNNTVRVRLHVMMVWGLTSSVAVMPCLHGSNIGLDVFKTEMLKYTRMHSCACAWTCIYDSGCSAKHTSRLALTGCYCLTDNLKSKLDYAVQGTWNHALYMIRLSYVQIVVISIVQLCSSSFVCSRSYSVTS